MKKTLFISSVILIFALGLFLSPALAQKSEKKNMAAENGKATSSSKSQGQANAEGKRSPVANFVQSLLNLADREKGGLGEQVRLIAREQNQAEATTTEAIEKVENRSKIKTFLFGSDYKNLGVLRRQMVGTRNRLARLTDLLEQTTATSTAEIKAQIKTLEEAQTKLQNFIKAQEGKISLFGWLAKLFNK